MKKITDFIIDKRYFILIIFIIITILCAFLSNKVNINYDIAKYLPDSSSTRIGMDIMDEEFSDSSTLNVMFKDLDKDKYTIKDELESISGVKEVSYDDSEKYNKDNYTLYVLSVDGKKDSENASRVYSLVKEKYDDVYTSGSVAESNKTVLPFWIVVLAVLSALVILLFMCESYVEPFLFLTVILMAVVINKGTNIIFPSVSHITNSICAILQMALSMDYSIMLMNRYDEEKKNEKDKIKAMKKALSKSFLSISSSSITTIVGLLALIFMSFKIGKDLGFILAKGVLFSLLCIFLVLPSLILLFDKWVVKTKKRSPNFKFTKLAKVSYKYRFLSLPVFLIVFLSAFFLKGNLGILYTDNQENEISKVFSESNSLAVVYPNEEEEEIANYLDSFKSNDKINDVLGYSNTINEKLSYDKLNEKLNDLGSDVSIDDYLLKIIYYHYFNKESSNKISFNEFINFIENEAYNNPRVNEHIDDNTKRDITRLKNFVEANKINKKRNTSDIASVLDIEEDKIKDLFIYNLSKNNNVKIGLSDFISFMNKDVLTNNKYSSKISNDNKSKIKLLTKFSDKNVINKKMNSKELADLLGIDSKSVDDLFKYYLVNSDVNSKISINEFANFVLEDVITREEYAGSFSSDDIENIKMLSVFSDKDIILKSFDSKGLANLFNIKEDDVNNILLGEYINKENSKKLKLESFIDNVVMIKDKTHYLDDVDIQELVKLKELGISDDKEYTANEMALLLNMPIDKVNMIYNLIDYLNGGVLESTPRDFVMLLLKYNLDSDGKLASIKVIMDESLNDTKYSYEQLSNLIGLDLESTKNIYVLYEVDNDLLLLTPIDFVNFVLGSDGLKEYFNDEMLSELSLVSNIMKGVVDGRVYSSKEISELLNIKVDDVNLLYGLYSFKYVNKNYQMSLKEFVGFVLNDVVTNAEYKNNFDDDKVNKLKTVNGIMSSSLNNVCYTNDEIFGIISKLSSDVEKKMIEVLYLYYGSSKEYNDEWAMTVEEFIGYLNDDIIVDEKFKDFINENEMNDIANGKDMVNDAKNLLVGDKYSRVVLDTNLDLEGKETFDYIVNVDNMLKGNLDKYYIVGDSSMAYEMNESFDDELNLITVITMVAIFVVVAITFRSILIPIILVFIIQCAVYLTMGILTLKGDSVYFISLLIVQSILMGATIDYAILYTSYYLEHRKTLGIKESVIESYKKAIHTILTSSSILIIVTLIIACFSSAIASKICKTISEGTICSTILILVLLPGFLAFLDRFIVKNKNEKSR